MRWRERVRLNSAAFLLLWQLTTLQEKEPLFLQGPMLLIKTKETPILCLLKAASSLAEGPSIPSWNRHQLLSADSGSNGGAGGWRIVCAESGCAARTMTGGLWGTHWGQLSQSNSESFYKTLSHPAWGQGLTWAQAKWQQPCLAFSIFKGCISLLDTENIARCFQKS